MPSPVDESLRAPVWHAAPTPITESSASRDCITDSVAASSDPQRASRYFNEFESRNPGFLSRLQAEPQRLHWLALIFGFSAFLSEEVLRHPEWLFEVTAVESVLSTADFSSHLVSFLSNRTATALDLALFRRKELLRIAIRDALSLGSVSEIAEEISNLADALFACALDVVTAEAQARYGIPATRNACGTLSPGRFTVLALGKLGGRELNYSSDVDLMFLYSGNGQTSGPASISNREFFKRVANQFTSLLSAYTAAGVCYRVDLRLRPEGSLGEVCVSSEGMKEYYSQRARDWELQMLIKARVAAGDVSLGQELLDFVEPLIYSTSLDFSTIETVSATRERIGEKLARKRLRRNQLDNDHLDVKLARGGIRDIEFLVQCLQRLHGARESAVRHASTLLALSRLLEKDLLSESEHARLAGAYRFLRNLEHRLQLEDDRQTHCLPAEEHDLERIARRMPPNSSNLERMTTGAELLRNLNKHLENVQLIYDRIVHSQRPLYYSAQGPAAPRQSAKELACSSGEALNPETVVREFLKHPTEAGMPISTQPELPPKQFPRPNLSESLAAVLEDRPQLADYTLQILNSSPFLAEQLNRYPQLVEEIQYVLDQPSARPAFEALAGPLNDMDGLSRFFRREMFRILASSICLPEPVFQTLDRTSGLAEFLIARAYRIALEQARSDAHAHSHAAIAKPFDEPQSQMMVVALGRLGMREFDLGSDADLLFIIPNAETSRLPFWTRVAEHIIEILTAYTGDGPILSIDTRLRPNGREGLLVQTESNYVEYFSKHAEAWEGIAYMKARAVAGDAERATAFLTELQQVDWRRYGQGGRSRQDLRQMRLRLQREQGASTPLKAAEGGYYDADFILMYLRLKGAGLFFKSLNTPERIDIVEKMGHLERADAEFLLEATTFYRAIDHALRIVMGRAVESLPSSNATREMVAELLPLWTRTATTGATLADTLCALQTNMRRLFDSIFG